MHTLIQLRRLLGCFPCWDNSNTSQLEPNLITLLIYYCLQNNWELIVSQSVYLVHQMAVKNNFQGKELCHKCCLLLLQLKLSSVQD